VELKTYWGLSIDEAIDKVEDERLAFESELMSVVNKEPGFEHVEVKDIFEKLHTNPNSLTHKNESHRKGKTPNFIEPFLRFYGIELEDGTIVITGGGIKLKRSMLDSGLDDQNLLLKRVQKHIEDECIVAKEGLF
jgi:hypothetical protein